MTRGFPTLLPFSYSLTYRCANLQYVILEFAYISDNENFAMLTINILQYHN
jgi:hypothetical protein